ncbi:hypothetical protein SAMN04487950_3476 [Halogranum rubrum]|uniref:DUF1440 domain-containing protein n=1 Tax=Halogranum rubrum TaxID=553466 RepID=A0A1I4GXG3_9EURY|nr:hypothetical protein [Halogranum rubrum]SFL34694.1 hypothetical protein SAMN04487950_3476 [Halogranum rubrum]
MKSPPHEVNRSDVHPRADHRFLSPGTLIRACLRGCTGGLIATLVMTLYRMPIFRALPPTAEFWAQYLGGGEAEQYPLEGFALHLLYGTAAGAVFGPVFTVCNARTTVNRDAVGVAVGLVYGLALSAFGTRVVFRHVLNQELEPEHVLVFHVGHAIYGLTLGTWLSSRERLGDVYEKAEPSPTSKR